MMASDVPSEMPEPDLKTAEHLLGLDLLRMLDKSHCDWEGHSIFSLNDEDLTEGKCEPFNELLVFVKYNDPKGSLQKKNQKNLDKCQNLRGGGLERVHVKQDEVF